MFVCLCHRSLPPVSGAMKSLQCVQRVPKLWSVGSGKLLAIHFPSVLASPEMVGHYGLHCAHWFSLQWIACTIIWLYHGCENHATEGETLQSPIHCCDVTKPPYLFSGELCTSSLHCKCLFVYTVCSRRLVSASLCSEHVNLTYWRTGRQ